MNEREWFEVLIDSLGGFDAIRHQVFHKTMSNSWNGYFYDIDESLTGAHCQCFHLCQTPFDYVRLCNHRNAEQIEESNFFVELF